MIINFYPQKATKFSSFEEKRPKTLRFVLLPKITEFSLLQKPPPPKSLPLQPKNAPTDIPNKMSKHNEAVQIACPAQICRSECLHKHVEKMVSIFSPTCRLS